LIRRAGQGIILEGAQAGANVVGLWLVLLGPGCIDFALDPIDPEGAPPREVAVHESFVQAPLPKADLLLVIDDTGSMAQEQLSLASHFAGLLDELDAQEVSWHVGVVSTDMNGEEAGWLRGSPWILTPDVADRDAVFAKTVQVGTSGLGPEAGLAAAVLALDLAESDGPNAGFRRADALLHVVFVSDADDQSESWLGNKPEATFLTRLDDETLRTALPAHASAVVGPLPTGCTSSTGTAQPATRYDAVVGGSGGIVVSICATDFAPVLATLSEATIVWQTEFPLRSLPVDDSTVLTVDGETMADGWILDPGVPAVRFDAPPPPEARIDVSYLVALDGA
jgi:hypothetical protein